MARVVITAKIKNPQDWERGFRSHADLFRGQPADSPYMYGFISDNEVLVSAEATDVDAYLQSLRSPETAKAMEADGVITDSMKICVLNREFSF